MSWNVPAAWRQLLLAFALGGLVAAAVAVVAGWNSTPSTTEDPAVQRELLPDDLRRPGAAPPNHNETAPACYLGVVLAQETVDVAAEIDGTLDDVEVRVGAPVSRGEIIAVLDTASLDHQLAIEQATLRTAKAERRRQDIDAGRAKQEHQRRLALEGLLSKEDEEKARFQWQTAQAMSEAAEAEVARVEARIAQIETRLRRSAIRTPFDAVVSQRYLDPGAVVRPGVPILRLISAEGLITRFAVPPDETSRLPIGTEVKVEVETLGLALYGSVEHLAPEIDAASQHIFLEARIDTGLDGQTPPSGAAARVSAVVDGAPASCFGG